MCAGLPISHMKYVRNISDGMPLFLFHYSERKMYGIFEADGPGTSFLKAYAWAGEGGDTPYPAQVGEAVIGLHSYLGLSLLSSCLLMLPSWVIEMADRFLTAANVYT